MQERPVRQSSSSCAHCNARVISITQTHDRSAVVRYRYPGDFQGWSFSVEHRRALPWPEAGSGDLAGGFGQLGEAMGQAGAGQDEVVGVGVFGLAEFGQRVSWVGSINPASRMLRQRRWVGEANPAYGPLAGVFRVTCL